MDPRIKNLLIKNAKTGYPNSYRSAAPVHYLISSVYFFAAAEFKKCISELKKAQSLHDEDKNKKPYDSIINLLSDKSKALSAWNLVFKSDIITEQDLTTLNNQDNFKYNHISHEYEPNQYTLSLKWKVLNKITAATNEPAIALYVSLVPAHFSVARVILNS